MGVEQNPVALSLTARQQRLIEGAPLHVVHLHVLTTYTDQSAKAVDTVRYFSDRVVTYDYGDTDTPRQFLPYVVSTSRQLVEQMPHLPSGGALELELLRDYFVTLKNVTPQGGTSLLADLRGELFEFSTLEVSELFLDPASYPEDPADLVGDEHRVIFRGELDGQPRQIDAQQFTLRFVTERLEGVLGVPVVGPTAALRDQGKRLPVVYGQVERVPLLVQRADFLRELFLEILKLRLIIIHTARAVCIPLDQLLLLLPSLHCLLIFLVAPVGLV